MLDCYGPLLDRPVIRNDFESKYPDVLMLYDQELDQSKDIYDEHMRLEEAAGNAPLNKNMPDVAGQLKWSAQLRDRISKPMGSLKHMEHP